MEPLIDQITYSADNNKYHSHFHNGYQMIYVMDGEILVSFHNQSFVAGPHSLIFISNLENHSVSVPKSSYIKYFNILTNIVSTEEALGDSRLLSVFKNRPPSFVNVFDVSAIAGDLDFLCDLLYRSSTLTDENAEAQIRGIFKLMLLIVFRSHYDQFPLLHRNIKSQIYDIQKYLDAHYTEPVSLQDLCREFYISFSYFSRSFKELTGYSPKQYITLHRLSFARNLVLNSSQSILDIAFQSGFSDINNFIRQFKQHFGMPPARLRGTLSPSGRGRE